MANPTANKIHIIADGGSAHTSHEVALFLRDSNTANHDYFKTTYDIELPGNTTLLVLSKIFKQNQSALFWTHLRSKIIKLLPNRQVLF